jgi:hypothetical protein
VVLQSRKVFCESGLVVRLRTGGGGEEAKTQPFEGVGWQFRPVTWFVLGVRDALSRWTAVSE